MRRGFHIVALGGLCILVATTHTGCVAGCTRIGSNKPFSALADAEKISRYREWLRDLDGDHMVGDYECTADVCIWNDALGFCRHIDADPNVGPEIGKITIDMGLPAATLEDMLDHLVRSGIGLLDMAGVRAAGVTAIQELFRTSPPRTTWTDGVAAGERLRIFTIECKEKSLQKPPETWGTCPAPKANATPVPGPVPTYGPVPVFPPKCPPEQLCDGA